MTYLMARRRACPVCDSKERKDIHSAVLTFGGIQIISHCYQCQMIYASTESYVDYDKESIYALPGALGSGESENDRMRLIETVQSISGEGYPTSIPILDVGCAQGGLLEALREDGYTDITGVDYSAACVEAARNKGLNAFQIGREPQGEKYGLVILCHVLEHVSDVKQLLRGCWDVLVPGGTIYIEVPDASSYSKFPIPFMDFNSEHINHFTPRTLAKAVQAAGLEPLGNAKSKIINLPHGKGYPAIYTFVAQPFETLRMEHYVMASKNKLQSINAYLEKELEGVRAVAIWGVNNYSANITGLPVFDRVMILQAIDRNPALHGRRQNRDVPVQPPEGLLADIPIVITTLMAIDSIRADIQSRGLKNRVISIPKEAYE